MPRPRALKVCACTSCTAHPGSCPELTSTSRCPACSSTAEARRGSRQQRGYGAPHDALRQHWQDRLDAGQLVECTRPTCVMPTRTIHRGEPWDLGHDDQRQHRGPEHRACNRGWRREAPQT